MKSSTYTTYNVSTKHILTRRFLITVPKNSISSDDIKKYIKDNELQEMSIDEEIISLEVKQV